MMLKKYLNQLSLVNSNKFRTENIGNILRFEINSIIEEAPKLYSIWVYQKAANERIISKHAIKSVVRLSCTIFLPT